MRKTVSRALLFMSGLTFGFVLRSCADNQSSVEVKRASYEYYFNSRRHAKSAISMAKQVLKEFGNVTIADINDITSNSNSDYVDEKYGWRNLDNVKITRTTNGVALIFPEPVKII